MKHIDKIKKLLRLSESTNENESRAALAKALELANQHAIDLDDLRRDQAHQGGMAHRWVPLGARISAETRMAYGIARDFYHVETCSSSARKAIVLVGREEAIEVAQYVVEFLVGACRRDLRVWEANERKSKRKLTAGKRMGFKHGFMIGVRVTLAEAQERAENQTTNLAIVLADERTQRSSALGDIVGETRLIKPPKMRRNNIAINAGYRNGRQLQINPAVKSGQSGLHLS
jgi:hypothetical protein